MRTKLSTIATMLMLLMMFCFHAQAANYEDTVKQWHSYEDVAKWMQENFSFVKKKDGTAQLPETTFIMKSGYCKDGAIFAIDALNRINPDYDAKLVYIRAPQPPSHYVTRFTLNGKLYIMDFASGPVYAAIKGIHGPFDSMRDIEKYLHKMGIVGSIYLLGKEDDMEQREKPRKGKL